MKTEVKVQKMIEMLTKKAETMLYDDYRVNLGMEREVIAKKWEKGEKSRTYIAIKCYSLRRNFKGEYKCGYIDNLTGVYVATKYDDFNLAEEMSEDEKTAFETLENTEKTSEEVAEEKEEKMKKAPYKVPHVLYDDDYREIIQDKYNMLLQGIKAYENQGKTEEVELAKEILKRFVDWTWSLPDTIPYGEFTIDTINAQLGKIAREVLPEKYKRG